VHQFLPHHIAHPVPPPQSSFQQYPVPGC
jgi:hypothetical protein